MPSIKKIAQDIWKTQQEEKKTRSDEMYQMKINQQ